MDAILEEAGSCGRFQVIHLFLTQLTRVAAFLGQCFMIYGTYVPAWRCQQGLGQDHHHQQQQTLHQNSSISEIWKQTTNVFSTNCTHNVSGFNTSTSTSSWAWTISTSDLDLQETPTVVNTSSSCDTISSCRVLQFDTDSKTIVSQFELICDHAWVPRILISVYILGTIFGSVYGGQVGEAWGRKVSLCSSTAIFTLACGISVLSVSWQMYAVFLFFIGFGDGAITVTGFVHGVEFLNSWWRGVFSSVPLWNISLGIFSALVFFLKDWRYIHIITAVIGFIAFLGTLWVPESVRWLLVRGRLDDVGRVVNRIAAMNGRNSFDLNNMVEFEEMKKKETADSASSKVTFLHLFRSKTLAILTLKLASVWVLIFVSFFAMGYGVSSLSGDFYVNLLVGSLLEVLPILSIGFASNRFGRKKAVLVYLIIAGSCCLASAMCKLISNHGNSALASNLFVFVAKGFTVAVWCAFAVLAVESFPTSVRNVGYGFLTMTSRIGGILSPLLIPQSDVDYMVCYVIIGSGLLIALVVAATLAETKDRSFQEGITDKDNDIEL